MYLAFDGDDSGDFLCSNLGWREFSEWGRSLDAKRFPNAAVLAWHGWCQEVAALRAELEAAPKPSDPDVAATLESLVRQLVEYGDAEAVAVTDGIVDSGDD